MPRSTVIPELAYPDIGAAIAWLCDVYGVTLRLRIGDHRAQNECGDGAVVLTRSTDTGIASLMVCVDDVCAHHERAAGKGARILQSPPHFPYGERQYSAADLAGHRWHFSQSIADVDPEDWGGEPGQL